MAGDLERDEFVSLYRRFRPGRFAELRGQPHVVRALQGAVRDGRVAHAYLFSGPRGTGKTSTARILARALNCTSPVDGEPCGTCASCVEIARGSSFDVHELDAASNNGVDAMRDLIAHAALATPGRWKVYIVDEVHMLSNAAANALLKTLEEPPSHVVFVLATTDPQKVPPTIRSRTQHLEFGLIGADTLDSLLHEVSTAAGLGLDDADIEVAVRKGRGSARDALSALDQVVASGSAEALRPDAIELSEALAGEDANRALVAASRLHEAGWGPQQIATELVDDLRQAFLVALAPELCAATGADRDRLAAHASSLGLPRVVRAIEVLGRAQVDMRDAPDPRAVLELSLVRLARPELDDSLPALLDRVARIEHALAGGAPAPVRDVPTPARPAPPAPPAAQPAPTASEPAPLTSDPSTLPAPPSPSEPDDVGGRPGLGALRRRRATGSAAAPPEAVASPPAAPDPADPSEVQPDHAGPDPAQPGPAPAQPPPDRDSLVEAWGDHILRTLPARAKALYAAGRFTSADGATVTFALPNAMHRDKCEDVRATVEQAIGAHFGVTVFLTLVVDGLHDAPAPAMFPTTSSTTRPPGSAPAGAPSITEDDEVDEVDPDQPSGSPEAVAQARLLEAFPGAEEVTG